MPYKVRLSCCALPRTPRERRSKAKRLRQFRRNHKESREIACPLWTYRVSIPQKTQRRVWGKPQAVADRKDEEPHFASGKGARHNSHRDCQQGTHVTD